ncbi:hypothetical protein Peur_049963 [Populus x canadensis]
MEWKDDKMECDLPLGALQGHAARATEAPTLRCFMRFITEACWYAKEKSSFS